MLTLAIATQQEAVVGCKAAWEEKERLRRQAKESAATQLAEESSAKSAYTHAELESNLAEAHLEVCRAGLQHAKLEQKLHRLRLAYFKDKIALVSKNVSLSDEDRTAPLELLRKQEENLRRVRESIQADIGFQQQIWLASRQKLSEQQSPDPALAEQVEAYYLAFETQQQRLAIVDQRLARIAGVRKAWARRFKLNDEQVKLSTLGEWRQEAINALNKLESEAHGQISRLTDVRRKIAALNEEIEANKGEGSEATKWRNEQLAQLEKLTRTYQRELDNLDNSHRLYDKLRADVVARGAGATYGERLEEVWDQVVYYWHFQLLAIDDDFITPHKVFKGAFFLIVGFWVARWIAGLFGRRVLLRVGVHPSGAAAIQTVLFYTLVCLLGLLALRMAKVPLTAFTILGGAVALGVGFGSQSIINNFISGLILLAERPIRVGDMIEIDGLHATVEKIGARSTRVVTSANLEIIVPNSKFLENNVVNWTLSNDRQRTKITIGVAYGSPADKVAELLSRAAGEHPNVLPHSETVVLFKDFGDNALVFELHFWISSRSNFERLRFESDMRYRIQRIFNEEGIVIAFPQRDIHLDASGPFEVRMVAENGVPAGSAKTTEHPRRGL
jgi:small-conductance mechanosensitive channel